ncbi:MAG: penicillin-binding protein 2 [Candidatus Sungbacteria bacterium]|nr:penicillin-binding protein 2 [Candidatus Sungbacteria bacterium]
MSKARLWILLFIAIGFGAAVGFRLFFIQVQKSAFYKIQANGIASSQSKTATRRGDIFFQDKEGNRYLAATTKTFLRLFIAPQKIEAGKEDSFAGLLSRERSIPKDMILGRIKKKEDPYERIEERIPLEQKTKLRKIVETLGSGLGIEEYEDRFYPYESLASHILGFVGFAGNAKIGLYGVEKYYDDLLANSQSLARSIERSVAGLLSLAKDTAQEGQGDGASIVLTLDVNIQSEAEKSLLELIERWKSPRGSIIVMRPHDGAILAMASRPSFDPNQYGDEKDSSVFINPALQGVFEPGSIMKPVTIGTGIEAGSVTPETSYVDTGGVERNGYVIHNAGNKSFGKRTVTEILTYSINTGAVFVAEKIGAKAFLRSLEEFGFGSKTGIDLPGEVPGDITNLDGARPVNLATAAFGQGISATSLQLIRGLNVIADGGFLVTPHVADTLVYANGKVETPSLPPNRKVVSSQTAAKVTAMLVEAVKSGYSKKAHLAGYAVAGKTGTAQIPSPSGGYSDQTIHSFVGFVPAYSPAFIVLMKLDEPLGVRFASDSMTPSFARLAQFLLQYYGIPPSV